MERLDLSAPTIEAIGAEVAERGSRSVLARPVDAGGGPSPWDVLRLAHRNLDNNWRGSDVRVDKLGPKRAEVVWAGQPCASVPYFVTSWGAFLRALVGVHSVRPSFRLVRKRCSATQIVVDLTWT